MSDLHLSRELLDAVFDGRRTVFDLAPVVFCHLFDLCPQCKLEFEAFRAELEESGEDIVLPLIPPEFEDLDQDDLQPDLQARIQEAQGRLRELLALPSDEQLDAIARTPKRFRGPLLAGLLVEESRERLPGRPKEAHTLLQLAKAVLEHGEVHPLTTDLYARAVAYTANALRAQGELRQADEVLGQARFLLKRDGGGCRFTRAELDHIEGALRRDQRRFSKAERLLARAVLGFRMEMQTTSAAQALLALGMVYREQDRLDRSIEVTRQSLELINPAVEPRLKLYAEHNLANRMCDAGDFAGARGILLAQRDSYAQYPDAWTQLRLAWVEARIARGLGEHEAAEQTFLSVRDGFLHEGNAYDAALVSLELATLILEEGRTEDVKSLAEELVPVFEAQEVHRESLAALILFRDAARTESMSTAFLEELVGYFNLARLDPSLPFQQPS